jgi:hypothetical protein
MPLTYRRKSYDGSLYKALKNTFPEILWTDNQNFFQDHSEQRVYFQELQQNLGIKHPEEWYNITKQQLHAQGAGGLLKYLN